MWIQLLTCRQFDIDGTTRRYMPGDWVEIGKQTALRMIEQGEARAVQPVKLDLPAGSGVLLSPVNHTARITLHKVGEIPVADGEPRLEYERTLIWDARANLRLELLSAGLRMLDRWQIAAPLWSYTELAVDIGSQAERERTKAVIRELRVPVYDTRILFMRRCAESEEVLRLWKAEKGDERLRFMRAVYEVKPLILALPVTWRRE